MNRRKHQVPPLLLMIVFSIAAVLTMGYSMYAAGAKEHKETITSATGISSKSIQEGRHYIKLLAPQPVAFHDKVEVIEFFSYSCPHCADLHPQLQKWQKRQLADVYFREVPAVFSESWQIGARVFYALEALQLTERLNSAVYYAMSRQKLNFGDEEILYSWIASQGVDRAKFASMYRSFAVDSQVRRAIEMTQEYEFGGVPTIVVGGKYRVASHLSSFRQMLQVADAVIAKNRQEIAQ